MTDVPADRRIVTVRLFAAARERAQADSIDVTIPDSATFHDVREALCETAPGLRPLAGHLLFAVGTTYASDDSPVPETGEIVAFPPVSGG